MAGKRHYRRYLPTLLGILVVLSIGALVTWMIVEFMHSSAGPAKKSVQQITLLTPPPPPPPPPKVEPPPPPPEVEPEVEVPEPEKLDDLPDLNDEAPPGDQLGLDAEGGAGDGFGLIGRKGGRGLLSGGAFSGFSRKLQDDINAALREVDKVRSSRYSVVAALWINAGGGIERVELQRGTGKGELDKAIVNTLLALRIEQRPPVEMPQPIRIRITSRL